VDPNDIEKIVLDTTRRINLIKKVQEFMFADIEKTVNLVNTVGAPNFVFPLLIREI
jgi:hypothetical protein